MKPLLSSLRALWRQLGLNQRVTLGLTAVGLMVALAALVFWARRPDFQMLYGRLGEKDTAAIVSLLQAQGIPHRLAPGSGSVYVPATHVHRLRMELAAKGLPGGDGVGFEIFDKGQFGLSDFVQRTNYTRAVQGELARTIAQLDGVAHARVMIVQPENRLLLTGQGTKTTASVFVELAGQRLQEEQVNSIRHLVANAVSGLEPDAVAVIDQKGRVLSAELREDPVLGLASGQIRYRQQVEDYLARKVESLLIPVVGAGNALVRVSADIDTDAVTRTEERYDPDGQVVRSQTATEDATTSAEKRAGGVAGVTANTPDRPAGTEDAPPVVTNEQNRKNRTTTYEINRALTNTTRMPGSVRRLTAAVFIAQRPPAADGTAVVRTPEELSALRRIVVNALGLTAAPGASLDDLVSVQEMPFVAPEPNPAIEAIAAETRVRDWLETGRPYVTVVIALGALVLFWRLWRSARPEPVPVDLLAAPPPPGPRPGVNAPLTAEMLNELIRQKPANVGTALRDWMAVKKN